MLLTKLVAEENNNIKIETPVDIFYLYDKYIKQQTAKTTEVFYFLRRLSYFIRTGEVKAANFSEKKAEIAATIRELILPDEYYSKSYKKCTSIIATLVNLNITDITIEEEIAKLIESLSKKQITELIMYVNYFLPKNNQNNQHKLLLLLKEKALSNIKEGNSEQFSTVFLPSLFFLIKNNYYDRPFLSAEVFRQQLKGLAVNQFSSLVVLINVSVVSQRQIPLESLWQYLADNYEEMPSPLFLNVVCNLVKISWLLNIKPLTRSFFRKFSLEIPEILNTKKFQEKELVYLARFLDGLDVKNEDFFLKLKKLLLDFPEKFSTVSKIQMMKVFDKNNIDAADLATVLEESFVQDIELLDSRFLVTLAAVYFVFLPKNSLLSPQTERPFSRLYRAMIKSTLTLLDQQEAPGINVRDLVIILNSCFRAGYFEKDELERIALFLIKQSRHANIKDICCILSVYTIADSLKYRELFRVYLQEIYKKKEIFLEQYPFNRKYYFRDIHDIIRGYSSVGRKHLSASDFKKMNEILDYFRDKILNDKLAGAMSKDRINILSDYLRYKRVEDQPFIRKLYSTILLKQDLLKCDLNDLALFCESLVLLGNKDELLFQKIESIFLSLNENKFPAINRFRFVQYLLFLQKEKSAMADRLIIFGDALPRNEDAIELVTI